MMIYVIITLSACGSHAKEEAEVMIFGIDFSQEEAAIQMPGKVVCGENCAWVFTTRKNDVIYQIDYETGEIEEVEWQEDETENVINIAVGNGTLYAEIQNKKEGTIEVKKHFTGGDWSAILTLEAEGGEEYSIEQGFFVDEKENVYLVSGNTVTCFQQEGQEPISYKLDGNACFFWENEDGTVECAAAEEGGIALYELREGGAEKRWTSEASAGKVYGIRSTEEGILCMASEQEMLFIDRVSGKLMARSDLIAAGISFIYAGNYDARQKLLYLYGKREESADCLLSSSLSVRDADAEQRIELVYGTVGWINGGVDWNVKAAITAFNQENTNYYITTKIYRDGELQDPQIGLQRLQADMAGNNAPDIIDLYKAEYFVSYVQNGYLEDLSPYLERSEYSDDLFWNVIKTYEVNGGFYLLPSHFFFSGVMIHPEYEQYVDEWNMDTYLNLIEINQWEKFIYDGGNLYLLYQLLCGRQKEFFDWGQKTVNLETEEFLDLLALCKKYGEQDFQNTNGMSAQEMWQDSLCTSYRFYHFDTYISRTSVYGRNYQPYGFPTSSGQSYQIGICPDSCGIYAGSRHKEGAWEFLESLLGDSHQEREDGINMGFPIRKTKWKALEEKGVEQKLGNEIVTMSESEFLIIENIIAQGELAADLMDYHIQDIVKEEAAAYFAGDRSAEEAAHIMQSRIELILQE